MAGDVVGVAFNLSCAILKIKLLLLLDPEVRLVTVEFGCGLPEDVTDVDGKVDVVVVDVVVVGRGVVVRPPLACTSIFN